MKKILLLLITSAALHASDATPQSKAETAPALVKDDDDKERFMEPAEGKQDLMSHVKEFETLRKELAGEVAKLLAVYNPKLQIMRDTFKAAQDTATTKEELAYMLRGKEKAKAVQERLRDLTEFRPVADESLVIIIRELHENPSRRWLVNALKAN